MLIALFGLAVAAGAILLFIPAQRHVGIALILLTIGTFAGAFAGMLAGGYVGQPSGHRVQASTTIFGFLVGAVLGAVIGVTAALALKRKLRAQR
jgi:hypothetical protein